MFFFFPAVILSVRACIHGRVRRSLGEGGEEMGGRGVRLRRECKWKD